MQLRNSSWFGVLIFLFFGALSASWAQSPATPSQPQSQAQKVQPTPLPPDVDPSDPALPVWARPATPPPTKNTNEAEGNVPANNKPGTLPPDLQREPGQVGQVQRNNGVFSYRVESQEVTLRATVVDQRKHVVTDLGKEQFTVYENGEPQTILHFSREDIPVSIGILVDNSGSMRTKRNAVTKAVVNLVKSSNPGDEVFIVNFNDEAFLDQDFTNNVSMMQEALDRVDSRGGTALYDAVFAASDHLAKAAKREKKVLLVVTDGEDNESTISLEQAIRSVQDENGPTIYTIGILGDEGKQPKRAKRALQALSEQTGGVAFFPKTVDEVDDISREVARDIRNQYTITYKPTNPQVNGGWREIKVVAHAPGYRDLEVRTRKGYFANEQRTASSSPSGER